MKAIVIRKYGKPLKVLKLKEVEKPVPSNHQVLIRVKATSINSWDYDLVRGKPYAYRLIFGLRGPKYKILGADVAGIVEGVGDQVTDFKPGDEVFGDLTTLNWGALAEYVCAPQDMIALKSKKMSFEEAASLPQAACMSLQAIRFKGEPMPQQQILLGGAGGGVGTFAIQVLKHRGAHVTAVDKKNKLAALTSLGADVVIDYQQTDYTVQGEKYHKIIDVNVQKGPCAYRRVLNDGGTLGIIGGKIYRLIQIGVFGKKRSNRQGKTLELVVHKPQRSELEEMNRLVEEGVVKPIVDRIYPLEQAAEAFEYYSKFAFFGKIVINCP